MRIISRRNKFALGREREKERGVTVKAIEAPGRGEIEGLKTFPKISVLYCAGNKELTIRKQL